ncbi:FAD-binding oxidoreductase [Candidatus Hodarchaeum mangrovi]
MKKLSKISKWGDRDSPHIKLTPAVLSYFSKRLLLSKDLELKDFGSKFDSNSIDHISPPFEEIYNRFINELGIESVSKDIWVRLKNSFGQAYLENLRVRLGLPVAVVELVLFPTDHKDVLKIINIANEYQIPINTVAGGTSVTLGIEPSPKTIAVNISKMDRIITINRNSFYVTAQTGISGPLLERLLNKEGFTLGHFPQSFEYSNLGGWIATRGAGQNSTLYGKIEDMILGLKMVTGSGKTLQIKPSPARATGPDINQLIVGSEGAFGIITESTLRIWKMPRSIKYGTFFFRSFEDGLNAYREILQRGYKPAIMRLSDPEETIDNIILSSLMKEPPKESFLQELAFKFLNLRGYSEENRCLGIMTFEGDPILVNSTKQISKNIIGKHGGFYLGEGPAKSWFKTRYETPFLRDPLIDRGVLLDTFETCATWDKVYNLYLEIRKRLKPDYPILWSHVSHVYANGANLYFTIFANQQKDQEINQFYSLRKIILDTIQEYGGILSHHHGIGRSFKNWLFNEIGEQGINILENLKSTLDPNRIMNLGVLNLEKK